LTAVRVHPDDADLEDALFRVEGLRGSPSDEDTWTAMVALARTAAGIGSDSPVKEDRKWGSVQAGTPVPVDVLNHGQKVYVFCSDNEAVDQVLPVLQRLRGAGLTVFQPHSFAEVAAGTSLRTIMSEQLDG
jgi:hypothetical protein